MRTLIVFLVGLAVGVYISDHKPEWAEHVRTVSHEGVESAQKLME